MAKWIEAYRCKKCKKVHRGVRIEQICHKCGTRFIHKYIFGYVKDPDAYEIVIARRRFFRWEVKENVNE